MENIVLTPENSSAGERLDKFISENISEISRSYAASLAKEGLVVCEGKSLDKNYRIKGGEL